MSEKRGDQTDRPLVFWQPILSVHQTPLLESIALDWPGPVHLVVEKLQPGNRVKESGWQVMAPEGVVVTTDGNSVPTNAVHVVSGFRGPRPWRKNRRRVMNERSASIWVMSESLPTWDNIMKVALRFTRHGLAYFFLRSRLEGFFSIGERAGTQARKLGMPAERVYPFCYVTSSPPSDPVLRNTRDRNTHDNVSQVLFIGEISRRKGTDLLFSADLGPSTQLRIIGSTSKKEVEIPENADYVGVVPNDSISSYLREADVLVLPSRHDGWGAVINEALMVGTPVVCTRACGGATLVHGMNPYRGEVLEEATPETIRAAINRTLHTSADRNAIEAWARNTITPEIVSKYMVRSLRGERMPVPWQD